MKDLTEYGEQELSFHVMSDAFLYGIREDKETLMIILDECFMYTDEQLRVLLQDLEDD